MSKEKISIQPIDVDKVENTTKDIMVLSDNANKLIITNQPEYESAAEVLKIVKDRAKELEAQRKEITVPLDTVKKRVMDLFRTPLDLLDKAETKIKSLMIGYTAELERRAREEQARLQRLADQEAEKQRKILEAKIERAKASGKEDRVEELEVQKENIVPITAPVIAPQIETPKGVSYRDKWTAVITDESLVPREYLMVNMEALNKIAGATKGTLKIAGVEFKSEKILASRKNI